MIEYQPLAVAKTTIEDRGEKGEEKELTNSSPHFSFTKKIGVALKKYNLCIRLIPSALKK